MPVDLQSSLIHSRVPAVVPQQRHATWKGAVVARSTPRVVGGALLSLEGQVHAVAVGTPAWYAWLENATTFAFASEHGNFTARKERSRRSGWYWKAYRKRGGTLQRAYLGKSADLSLDRLTAIATELTQRPVDQSPTEFPIVVSVARAVPDAKAPPLRTLHLHPEPAPAQPLALLTTKLYAPQPRLNLVSRSRLVERVQAGSMGKLTLIAAPAGFGKTTLVSAWRATLPDSQTAVVWVSLDAGDNDLIRFWSYVIAALNQIEQGVGATALTLLQSPQPPPMETILIPLLNALSAIPHHIALVLDDYHVVDTPAIHQTMAFLLDHLPPCIHLIILTRVDPPLPLTRLRVRSELTELRAADLRFTVDEAATFLTGLMGLPLSAANIAALETRTEGWIAGLQFAALAMRDRSDLASFIAAFTGSNRFVVDYLAEEVINRLPRHLQTFLIETSILDRMCASLCDAVILGDRPGPDQAPAVQWQGYSQALLAELERTNLFAIPLDDDRCWYRYHHLFADVLRGRLMSGATRAAV
jgi:LuxR family transcriptional regulator, maltose regulon positive regulatory protein